jgi:hypothetical protein
MAIKILIPNKISICKTSCLLLLMGDDKKSPKGYGAERGSPNKYHPK